MGKKPTLYTKPYTTKEGTVYSQLPLDGSGDWTFSRDSIATRVDENGIIETVAANIPRIDYSVDSRGCLLLEPERTNILIDTDVLSTQSVTTEATTYVLSFYGTGTITLTGTSTDGPLVGTSNNQRVYLVFTPTAGSLTLTVSGSVLNAQLEAGTFPTSYIPTTVAEVTRAADYIELTTDTNNVLSSLGGTLILDLRELQNHTVNNEKGLTIGQPILPADYGSGAAAAYSLRYVANAYAESEGSVVRVRRTIDNAEADFTAKEVSDGTLETWVKGGESALPLDTASAAAAYSLRNLSTNYTGPVVRVRRSSDNAEADFTATEVSDGTLEAWVNEDVVQYESDFSSTEDFNETNGIGAAAQSIGGVNDAYKFTLNGGNTFHTTRKSILEENKTYNIQFDYYIPSSNSIVAGISAHYGTIYGLNAFTELDGWYSASVSFTPSGAVATNELRFTANNGTTSGWGGINADGDVFYLKNIVVTQTTADGFVTTWYDQSGNSNDATQATAANQPQIVDAGLLITDNGKAALDFDGSDDYLSVTGTSEAHPNTYFTVFSADATGDRVIGGMSPTRNDIAIADPNYLILSSYTLPSSGGYVQFKQNLLSALFNSTSSKIWLDSAEIGSGNAGTEPLGDFNIGATLAPGNYLDGKLQELIAYPTDQTSNRTTIEANINNYYTIYGDGHVVSWYDQSGNLRHANQSVAANQPKLVDAGVLVTENGKAAVDFDGVDDQFSLANTQIITNINQISAYNVCTVSVLQLSFGLSLGSSTEDSRFYLPRITTNLWLGYGDDQTEIQALSDNANQNLHSANSNGTNVEYFINGASQGSNLSQNTDITVLTQQNIGGGLEGFIQEIIVFDSDESSNRTAIENAINYYYNIFGTPTAPSNEQIIKLRPSTTGGKYELTAGTYYNLTKLHEIVSENANVAFKWDGTNITVYEDGVVVGITPFTKVDFDVIRLDSGVGYPLNLNKVTAFNRPADDEKIKEIAQSNKGLLDFYPEAAAAYSLRSLSESTFNSPVVRLRRSSDNTESDFTATEILDGTLTDWVNEDITQYNYSTATQMVADFASVGGANSVDTIGGQEALKFTINALSGTHFPYRFNVFGGGGECSISFDYYIPSTNTDIDGIQMSDASNDIGATQTTQDAWTSVTVTGTLVGVSLYIFSKKGPAKSFTGNGTDVFYIKNLVVTQTTADGLVTTWYDQSGNDNHATQATAANQPKLIDAGSLVLKNGKPAVDFDGTDDYLGYAETTPPTDFSAFFIGSTNSTTTEQNFYDYGIEGDGGINTRAIHSSGVGNLGGSPSNTISVRSLVALDNNDIGIPNNSTGQILVSHFFDGVNIDGYLDATQMTDSYSNRGLNLDFVAIGSRTDGTFNLDGTISEVIFYTSDQSTKRTAIETDINSHYKIY